jgi:type I restriction enzyme, S subunit
MNNEIFNKNLQLISGFECTPENWQAVQVSAICSLGRGRVISQDEIDRKQGSYPVYSSQTSNNGEMGKINSFDFDGEHVTWTTDGANAGTVFLRNGKFNCTNVCGTLKPIRKDQVNLSFLHYHLNRIAKNYVSYIGNPKLMNDVMGRIALLLPPFSEQFKISEILSKIDCLIEKTQSLIAKYNAIKQGMMRDLFTRGVGKNGELRPQYVEAARSYKESKLGWIPKDWNVTTLGDGCHRITDGAHASVVTSQDGDVPFLYVSCVRENLIDWEKASFISRKTFSQISKGREPEPGMILYTVVGSYGYAALIEEQKDFSFQRHIGCIYPDDNKFVPSFLVQLLNADRSKAFADSVAVGNAQKTITLGTLKKFPVICPPKDEQNVIAELIESIQSSTAFERNTLEKLLLLKSGLMQDLLTGKVRVKVDASMESTNNVGVHQS